ncbi:MAG TPA: ATP-dependent 6-phosphofructokinase [Candidatus Latescibacteria bacterium]|nr:ATP-dependent 6-phosphofructokinase [Candidatus Latescibacterota bacterium]
MVVRRIGLLTSGGDCPGLNAVIRAVIKTAVNEHSIEVVGIEDGYEGLILRRTRKLGLEDASGILTIGGTILGTSNRANPFGYPTERDGEVVFKDRSDEVVSYIGELGLDALVCVGGDGTLTIAHRLFREKGIPVVGVPKTIDNDLYGTDQTFGFDSALSTATEAVDKLHTTAQSHHRVMVIEVMGRNAGWLALGAGLAGGGDVILIPEVPFRVEAVCEVVEERVRRGKRFSIVVVSEGAYPQGGEPFVRRRVADSMESARLGGVGEWVGQEVERLTGMETRVTTLGHLQRGGTPTPFDRILATRFGREAVKLIASGNFDRMAALHGTEITSVPLDEVAGRQRRVPLDSHWIACARSLGVGLGE